MNIDYYSTLNRFIKKGDIKSARFIVKALIKTLNAEQKAYKHILSVDYNVCLQTTYRWFDGKCFTYYYNPIQSKSKQTSTKLAILYSTLNILDGKPTNHIPSDLGEAINDVLPTLVRVFDGTDYLPVVIVIQKERCEAYRALHGITLNKD